MEVFFAKNESEVTDCFQLISELRPQLTLEDFISKVKRMSKTTGYELVYLDDSGIKAVAGMKVSEWLHSGRYLEVEELVTDKNFRSKGYGGKLFDWIIKYAKQNDCAQIRLVSGVSRDNAHKFYLNRGMIFEAKYFSLNIDKG